jgi:hypothetical protein
MPGKVLKRRVAHITADTIKRSAPPSQDLAGSNPEWLRDRVFNALNALSLDERESIRDKILSGLRNAGVNIPSGLMKLGIPASTPGDLSPSDIAKLVRYVRMNTPEAMRAFRETFAELIALEARISKGAKPLERAA